MAEKNVFIRAPYLNLPVRSGAPFAWVCWDRPDGCLLGEFYLELDFEAPDYYVVCDMTRFRGETLVLRIDDATEEELAGLALSAEKNIWTRLPEPERPKIHFTPFRGIMGDPNGLYAADGRYHAFYQLNPYGTQCGDWIEYCNFGWAPADSGDLCRWMEGPRVLLPDEYGPAFSGTAFVDTENASGLGDGVRPPVLLYYTAAGGQSRRTRGGEAAQRLMVSTNGGESFTPYAGNPVLPNFCRGNRDPKVFRHRESGRYILVLYSGEGHLYYVCSSRDLLHWERLPDFLWEDWECPDVLEVPVEGEGRTQLVFWSARGYWAPVDFDGVSFTRLAPARVFDEGNQIQCGQSFANLPGRCVQMHRFNFGYPGAPWYGAYTLPYELTLAVGAGNEYALKARPAREIDSLETLAAVYREMEAGETPVRIPLPVPCRIRVEAELETGGGLRLCFGGFRLELSEEAGRLSCGALSVNIGRGGRYRLDIVWDGPLLEAFEEISGRLLPAVSLEAGEAALVVSGRKAGMHTLTVSSLSL